MKLTKNQKIGIGGGIVFVATLIGIKVHKKRKERRLLEPNASTYFQTSDYPKLAVTFPLKFGDRNSMVKRFQIWANSQAGKVRMITGRNFSLKEDGIFGKNTQAAVRTLLKSDTVSKAVFEKYNM
jgi:hypothetical protein